MAVAGEGPRLLLLHGLSAHAGTWEEVARLLRDRFTLVMPDLLSRGRSDARPDLPHDLEHELRRTRAVARATGTVGRPVLGHSQGAALALATAAAPPSPSALVLVCPVTPWTRRPASLDLLRSRRVRAGLAPVLARLRRPLCRAVLRRRVFADPSVVDPPAVERWAEPFADPRRAEALLRTLAEWRPGRLASRMPSGPPPCRVVAGARDRRIRPGEARRLAGWLDAELEVVQDAAHMVPVEAPDAVVRALESVTEANRTQEA